MESRTSWTVYIGRCQDGSFYTGISQDVDAREARHNSGKGSLHVRAHGRIEILWTEEHPDLVSARRREIQIKGWTRQKKLALVEGDLALLKRL